MYAVYQSHYGKPDVLRVGEFATPSCGPNDLLIKNSATSVNPRDCLIRAGRYQLQFLVPKRPLILGSDCYGEVLAVGHNVANFSVGDWVYGLKNPSHGLGCYASHVTIDSRHAAQAPRHLPVEQAAGVPLCGLTAWQALISIGQLKAGQKVLVIGASGGVGHLAVQIARCVGAAVDGVCSQKNTDLVRTLGASRVIDYQQQPLSQWPGGYDLVFDSTGRYRRRDCQALLQRHGCLVSTVPTAASLVANWQSRILSTLRYPHQRSRIVMVEPSSNQLGEITRLIDSGDIVPVVDSVFAMEDAAQAHRRSQSRHAVGKIIIHTAEAGAK